MSQIIEMGGSSSVDGALPEFPAGSSRVISPTALQGVRGNVVAAKSGLPLAGVEIHWITSEHFPRHRNGTDVVIGTAISEADGRFSIVSSVSSEAETILCQLKHETGQSTQLQIPSLAKNGSAQRFAISTTSLETIIRISGPAPKKAQWAAFADYQMTNRRLIVSDLAQELVAPAVDSPVRSWTLAARAGALDALDAASGDGPKTFKFAERETPVKFEALAKGDITEALKFYQDGIPIDLNINPGIFSPWLPLPKGDTELYRDYLRGVWVQAAQQMALKAPGTPAAVSEDVLARQLFTRFHQDFRTSDSVKVPAAKLLAKILKVALTTTKNRDGFGKAAGAIPAQGTTSDEDYIDVLIGLTGVKPRELQNRYRIGFVRSRGGGDGEPDRAQRRSFVRFVIRHLAVSTRTISCRAGGPAQNADDLSQLYRSGAVFPQI